VAPVSERTGDRERANGRAELAVELRGLALLALDRLEPLLAGAPAGSDRPDAGSTPCPVCAALAVLRGEHPELAERVAGLVAVLREALDDSVDVSPPPRPQAPRVQRIPVERVPAGRDGARC
jgi:hypothetical protein